MDVIKEHLNYKMNNIHFIESPSLRYISLFSGIGGFEQAIHQSYPDADCIGFSEVDPYAIKIYRSHFPNHTNLGDITKINHKGLRRLVRRFGCDLIVGGFPCTNLSSMANMKGNSDGLNGPKSGLFYDMIKIIESVRKENPNVKFIIENNFSMKKSNREEITETLREKFKNVCSHTIDNSLLGVQCRKRIIWTNFPFEPPKQNSCIQQWEDVLEPFEKVKDHTLTDKMVSCLNKLSEYANPKGFTKIAVPIEGTKRYRFEQIKTKQHKSRWDIQGRSDTMETQIYTPYPVGKSRPITAGSGGGNNMVLDRRGGDGFIPRNFFPIEIERLFGLPSGYTDVNGMSDTKRKHALGNSIPVFIAHWVVKQY